MESQTFSEEINKWKELCDLKKKLSWRDWKSWFQPGVPWVSAIAIQVTARADADCPEFDISSRVIGICHFCLSDIEIEKLC